MMLQLDRSFVPPLQSDVGEVSRRHLNFGIKTAEKRARQGRSEPRSPIR